MAWVWRRTRTPSSPVYSEYGQRVCRLLETEPDQWEYYGFVAELYHAKAQLAIRWINPPTLCESDRWSIAVGVGTSREGSSWVPVTSQFTPDDLKRIRELYQKVITDRENLVRQEALSEALARITPNPFDDIARELARAVLKGDQTAGHALVDHCLELLQGD